MKAKVLALAILWAAGSALAQTPDGAPPPPDHGGLMQIDNLATLLDLSDTQKPQVQAILEEEHAKMKELFDQAKASGTRPSFEHMHAAHEQILQDAIQKLTPVLNAAQLKKFEVLAQDRGPPRGLGAHSPPTGDSSASPPQN